MKNEKNGFSLVEILLVTVAVGILVLLLGSVPNSVNLIGRSKQQSLAREIIAKEIEEKRAVTYVNLPLGQTQISDLRLELLPDGYGTTVISGCNAETDPAICPNGENIKQITITVNWKTAGKDTSLKVQTLISEGGLNQ